MSGVDLARKADPRSLAPTLALLRASGPVNTTAIEIEIGAHLPPPALPLDDGASGTRSARAPRPQPASAPPPLGDRERLDRLADALRPKTPAGARPERDALVQVILGGARSGLAKLNQGEAADQFTLAEQAALESVIVTDGTRPSLLVHNGFVDLAAADAQRWKLFLSRFKPGIMKLIAAVGRIDIPAGQGFIGTCFAIAPGLVVTNRHVLEDIATQRADGGWALKIPDETTIDFRGEEGENSGSKFKVLGAAFAGPDPINGTVNFAHLDLAILKVDPASDPASAFPEAVTFETDLAEPQSDRNIYVLGFPGEPNVSESGGTPPLGTETRTVLAEIFHDTFGVKNLAPGAITRATPCWAAISPTRWVGTNTHPRRTPGASVLVAVPT